ncbi:hypothetical protein BaRGS_00031398 [Batillaria attramentaria]|uniref:Uncharacterized protein n=1 Tax=Batillaria attramentaria TaxID=370345 RepID=A0ABD0JR49_9CAEN
MGFRYLDRFFKGRRIPVDDLDFQLGRGDLHQLFLQDAFIQAPSGQLDPQMEGLLQAFPELEEGLVTSFLHGAELPAGVLWRQMQGMSQRCFQFRVREVLREIEDRFASLVFESRPKTDDSVSVTYIEDLGH